MASKFSSTRFHRYAGLVSALLLLAVVGEFILRGPVRAIEGLPALNDFAAPYAGSRAWTLGLNPYDSITTCDLWKRAGGDPRARELLAIYPPTSFVVLAPFSLLSWRVAMRIWTCITVALFLVACIGLLRLAGLQLPGLRAVVFLILAVGLAPIQTGIGTGNIAVAATMLGIIGVWIGNSEHNICAAIFLAAGCVLKPHLGIWFLVYYVVRRRWAIAIPALTIVSVCAFVALGRLWHVWPIWIESYSKNYQSWFAIGSIDDFSTENPNWFQMLNLQGIFYVLHPSRPFANVAAWLVFAVAFAVWLYAAGHKRNRPSELLSLSGLLIITLFPLYHRFYDAGLLLFPICWALASLSSRSRWQRITLLLSVPFLLPGPALAYRTAQQGWLGTIPATYLWRTVILGHQVWILLLLGCVLLGANVVSLRKSKQDVSVLMTGIPGTPFSDRTLDGIP